MHLTTQRFAGSCRIAAALLLPALGMGLLTACGSDAAEETPTKTPEVVETKDTTEESCIRVQEFEEDFNDFTEDVEVEMATMADETEEKKFSYLEDMAAKHLDYADTVAEIAHDAENQELADGMNQLSFGVTLLATLYEEGAQLFKEAFDEGWSDEKVISEMGKLEQENLPSAGEQKEFEKGVESVNEICDTGFPPQL